MMRKTGSALGLLALLGACASTPPGERHARRLALYTQHAGAPVPEIRGFTLSRFEIVGPESVVIWVRVSEPYLVTVQSPCPGLEWARRIGFEQDLNVLRARYDGILVEGIDCRIREIRPVDGVAFRAAERAAGD